MSFYLTRSGRFQNMFYDFLRPTSPGGAPLRCAVAIPAKNEVDRLPACLNALALQRRRSGEALAPGVFEVVLFANNCDDGTADRAREFALHLPFQIHVTDERLAPAVSHAGEARRRAMDLALACLERRGAGRAVILTTDADSLVPATWIDENLSAIDEGADAVLGRVALDEDGVGLPVELHRRGALEDEYENLLTETASILDPVELESLAASRDHLRGERCSHRGSLSSCWRHTAGQAGGRQGAGRGARASRRKGSIQQRHRSRDIRALGRSGRGRRGRYAPAPVPLPGSGM